MTYQIVRYFRDENKPSKVIRRKLTLEEAKSHCSREWWNGQRTRAEDGSWFDGFKEVQRGRRRINGNTEPA